MASGNAPCLIVVSSKVKASRMGNVYRDEWYTGVKEGRTNLRGDVYVDLRINDQINFLLYEALRIFERYTRTELVIAHHKLNVRSACSAEQTVGNDSCECEQVALRGIPNPKSFCTNWLYSGLISMLTG